MNLLSNFLRCKSQRKDFDDKRKNFVKRNFVLLQFAWFFGSNRSTS